MNVPQYQKEMEKEIPKYYKGKNGYMAKDVVTNFDLSYNIGTAVTYLLRAGKKEGNPKEQAAKPCGNFANLRVILVLIPKAPESPRNNPPKSGP